MVGVGVWALVRWLTYNLMAMATVWRGRDVEDTPSRRSGDQVGSGRVKPGVESSRVASKYRIGSDRSGPVRPDQPAASCGQTVVSSNDRSNGRARESTHHDGREEPSVPSASHRVGTMRVACEREEGGKRGATAGR